ncbi:carbonic anhydrase [Flavihumibacter cheonanensis]|jgi:carbonic anhydrase|uniref:carbonic anhydrase n=1 Tax=Flavihumibacter cheonanensis TaxID=1442385 RepID=UPI001EF8F331|nr:carbonic anhydrase [Flavihumibacter cheonanensis]MCG7752400.1 carbonic anhydrase [Flavihumibacter cheonanensis]
MKKMLLLALTGWLVFCTLQTDAGKETTSAPTAAAAVERLLEGNKRYTQYKPIHPDESRLRRKELTKGQHPYAVVVTCSDSRVSPELVFDQGLGDIFVIRTAGNIMGDIELGSIEYAVEHLNVPLVMVVGHEGCGAIGAYMKGEHASGHLKTIVDSIAAESEIKALQLKGDQIFDHFVKANIQHGVREIIQSSPVIRERIARGSLTVMGGYERLEDGKVEPLNSN